MKSLFIRTISGIAIVILTVSAIYFGSIYLASFIFLLSIIGIHEFYDAVKKVDVKPVTAAGYISCICFLMNSLGIKWFKVSNIFIIIIIFLLAYYIIKRNVELSDIAVTFFSVFYIPFLLQHIIYLRDSIHVWLIFLIAWGTDTFAYVFGMLFGKHKLCPKLSPKKTIEGSLGGIIGSMGLTYLFVRYFKLEPYSIYLLISFFGSIIAQIGDLTASKIKRMTGIKDFGFIMPGHGGVLDRFDSILFIAPYTYYLLKYLL